MTDFLLARQASRLADLAATLDTHGTAGDLADDLRTVLDAVGSDVPVPAGTAEPAAASAADVLDAVTGVVAVCGLIESGAGADLAAHLRWLLHRHGRPADGPVADPTAVPALALVGAADDTTADEVYDQDDLAEIDVPVRWAALLTLARTDGVALTTVEAGAAVGALEPTLSRLGQVTPHGRAEIRPDGTAVVALAVTVDGFGPTAAAQATAGMSTGTVVFDGILPLAGADVAVQALWVDAGEDAPIAADGGLDIAALLDATDTDDVLAGRIATSDTLAAFRDRRDQMLAELARDAEDDGDPDTAAELDARLADGPDVPRDDDGRPLLDLIVSRADGQRLDGPALEAVVAAARRTLGQFGTLDQVAVDVDDESTVVTFAVGDTDDAAVTTADVADGLVSWGGTLPFDGVGDVTARLALPACPMA